MWVPRRTGVTRIPFGTSTVYCYCSDCRVMPGARVSIAYWSKHVAWHAANGRNPGDFSDTFTDSY